MIRKSIHENRIGIMGGCFDPIHTGHLIIAEHVADALSLGSVIFVPCSIPPHKNGADVSPSQHRLRMVELAVAGNPRFKISSIEIERGGISYSIDTVEALKESYGSDSKFYFIIGADSLMELGAWREYKKLLSLCVVVTAGRPGWDIGCWPEDRRLFSEAEIRMIRKHMVETPLIDISSTAVRKRRSEGKSIRYLVPVEVEKYIRDKNLYRPAGGGEK